MQILYKILDTVGYYNKRKALVIPVNSEGKILIQDRRGHRPPPWSYFGGGIEIGETPIQAVIREMQEELDITVLENELQYIGMFPFRFGGLRVMRYMFTYKTDQETFNVLEGAGAHWLSMGEAKEKLTKADKVDEIVEKIKSV